MSPVGGAISNRPTGRAISSRPVFNISKAYKGVGSVQGRLPSPYPPCSAPKKTPLLGDKDVAAPCRRSMTRVL